MTNTKQGFGTGVIIVIIALILIIGGYMYYGNRDNENPEDVYPPLPEEVLPPEETTELPELPEVPEMEDESISDELPVPETAS